MILKKPIGLIFGDIFVELSDIFSDHKVNAKLEGFSHTGSIKVKSAIRMLSRLELEGRIKPGGKIIESSSGNLGLALSVVCAAKGYQFSCVSDPQYFTANLAPD